MFQKDKKVKVKPCAVDVSSNRQVERTPRKLFRWGSEDHMIAKCPKQVCFNENFNYACDNGESNSDCKIYASTAQMSSNDKYKNHVKTENWDKTLV